MNIRNKQSKQQGIALVMALIMLLVITMIGLASVRGSKNDTQAAGNSMFSLMVYQGAESALDQISGIKNEDIGALRDAALVRGSGIPVDVPDTYYNPSEEVNGATLSTSAQMIYSTTVSGSQVQGIHSDDAEFLVFRTTATSTLDATGARAVHIQGTAVQKQN